MTTKPKNGMRPVHPGEILAEDFMKPLSLSANRLGGYLGVPPNRISAIGCMSVAQPRA